MPAKRWFFGWLPLWVASYLVVQGALLTPEEIPAWFIHLNDKVVHGIEYALLFLAAVNAFYRAVWTWIHAHVARNGLIYCAVLGAVTECLQFLVPGRGVAFTDWLADVSGACLGMLVWKIVQRIRPAGESFKTGVVA